MIDQELSAETKELIHNDQFILWCLNPTKVLDDSWNQWKIEHPDQIDAMNNARAIVCSVNLNVYTIPSAHSLIMEERLQESLNKKARKRSIKVRMYSFAAACAVVILFLLGTWMLGTKDQKPDITYLFTQVGIAKTQKEVELILENHRKMLLENRTNIQFSDSGLLLVDKKQQSIKSDNTFENLSLNILKVPKGRRSSLVLGDGTKIWVDSGTVVYFPSIFGKNDRTIYVNGEIFLEVTKDADRPFKVKTSKMDVRVLGTSFNVNAYNDNSKESVVLCKGSVDVNNRSGKKDKIRPQEMLTIENNQMSKTIVNTYNYTFWVDETFIVEGKSLDEVFQQLSRYYRVKFECSDDVKKQVCSGKLILFDDVKSVMKTLTGSFPITFSLSNDTIIISNKKKFN